MMVVSAIVRNQAREIRGLRCGRMRWIGRTFVAVADDNSRVLGYYTLATGRIAFEDLPEDQAKKLPRIPVPVVLLARLAVDRSRQGTGLGTRLLMNALARVRRISAE